MSKYMYFILLPHHVFHPPNPMSMCAVLKLLISFMSVLLPH
jgi:hypothetical protein